MRVQLKNLKMTSFEYFHLSHSSFNFIIYFERIFRFPRALSLSICKSIRYDKLDSHYCYQSIGVYLIATQVLSNVYILYPYSYHTTVICFIANSLVSHHIHFSISFHIVTSPLNLILMLLYLFSLTMHYLYYETIPFQYECQKYWSITSPFYSHWGFL